MESKGLQIATDLDADQEEVEIIAIQTLCRLCATQNERLIGIYSEEGFSNDLSNKINLYLPIKVAASDELPLQCCWNCASTLLAWHELVVTSVEIDRKFRNSQFIPEKAAGGDDSFESSVRELGEENDVCDNEGTPVDLQFDAASSDSDAAAVPPPEMNVPIICHICHATVSRSRDLKRHMLSCQPVGASPKDFADVANLTTKTCTECSISFETRTELKKHVEDAHQLKQKRHRRRKDEILPQFFCEVCNKGFTRKYDMEKHRSGAHALTKRKKKNLEVLALCRNRDSHGKVYYKCDFCEQTFSQSYNLMRHRTVHTGVKEFSCHICGAAFRILNGLTRHIQSFHNGVRNFGCEICEKTFTARATRDEHMNIHTNTRPFVCDVCGKTFKQRASLHVHKMFHSDTYRFQCTNCGKKFRRRQDLKVHSWLHTGQRPHVCPKCDSAFRLRHDLTRHLRTHEKQSECACHVCGSVFSQERYLKVHRRIHGEPALKAPKAEEVDA